MSNACIDWYENNVNSKNAWDTTITSIFYN